MKHTSMRHWAEVEAAELPPPSEGRQLHSSRLVVHVTDETESTQCVTYERYRPVCFHNLRPELKEALRQQLWPAFPEVVLGTPADVRESDYLLQVELTLDALPPDDKGPGWSAGARSRFRLMRDGKVLEEQTLASRSRAEFPYGAPLGAAASEVVDASVVHIAREVSKVEESQPPKALPLPAVAARRVEAPADDALAGKPNEAEDVDEAKDAGASSEGAKQASKPRAKTSAPKAKADAKTPAHAEPNGPKR